MGVDEHTTEVAGASVFYRRAPAAGTEVLYLHSVPTSSDDWIGALELSGGLAPDLPGFGRSDKAGNLDYSLAGFGAFVESFLDVAGIERVSLVGHGWGAAMGLLFAQRHPERVARLALVDAVPLLEGFSWPRIARWLRRPGVGELVMGSVNKWLLARTLRAGSAAGAAGTGAAGTGAAGPGAWPDARVDAVWDQFDQGTQRAILRLHRSVDEAALADLGAGLGTLSVPGLVVWGSADPWLAPAFADAYGARLAGATVEHVAGAGHWPWLDQPAVLERLAAFAAGSAA